MKDMNALRNTEVLNEDNEPMFVAHWTDTDFDAFDEKFLGMNTDDNADSEAMAATAHLGFFFNAGSEELSDVYATKKEAYLNIENPFRVECIAYLAAYIEASGSAEEFKQQLIADGHDGIIVEYDEEFGGVDFIPFSTDQIFII